MRPIHLPGPRLSFAHQLQEFGFLLLCEVHHVDFFHRSVPLFHLGILREPYIRQNSGGKVLEYSAAYNVNPKYFLIRL